MKNPYLHLAEGHLKSAFFLSLRNPKSHFICRLPDGLKLILITLLFFGIFAHKTHAQLIPTMWDFSANSTGWTGNFSRTTLTNASTCGSAAMRRNMYSIGSSGSMISPVLPGLSNGGIVVLTYKYKTANYSSPNGPSNPWGYFNVQYGPTATGPWTTFATVSQETQTGTCLAKTHYFQPPTGNVYIKFDCFWTSGDYYLTFDDIQIVNQGSALTCEEVVNGQTSDGIGLQTFSIQNASFITGLCPENNLYVNYNVFDTYFWKKDGQIISGASSATYLIPQDPNPGLHTYICEAYCAANGQTVVSNSIDVQTQNCFSDYSSNINYMLVQNVTTTGINTANQTAQIQFDLNWGYSWKDSINWDAAWVFMKYKSVSGEWKPCKIKTTGYDHGQGTPNNINVPADQMGAFVSLSQYGNAHVDIQGLQLQWDYSAEGLSNPEVVEVKVFAIEMVYIPQGDFNVFKNYYTNSGGNPPSATILAPGSNSPVINDRLSPPIAYTGPSGSCRIKGDAGLDSNADGVIDYPQFPTGFKPFYAFKFEMSEQQYADFLNCLNPTQQANLGLPIATTITTNNGIYFASSPNRACNLPGTNRVFAYADWTGLRPMSVLEFSKAALGPYKESSLSGNYNITQDVGFGDSGTSTKTASGSGYYGMKNMGGMLNESVVHLNSSSFDYLVHGNGQLGSNGLSDVLNWQSSTLITINPYTENGSGVGARLARTAE